jgi:hypothetical protein
MRRFSLEILRFSFETLRFLCETWQLWYWAMFCPSKLQHRMNQWITDPKALTRQTSETNFADILLANPRFIAQYLLLVVLFCLPLVLTILRYYQWLDWIDCLVVVVIILLSYGTGICLGSLGLHTPLFWSFVYLAQREAWRLRLTELTQEYSLLLFLSQPTGLLLAGILTLIVTLLLCIRLLKQNHTFLAKNILAIGGMLGVLLVVQGTLMVLSLIQEAQLSLIQDTQNIVLNIVLAIPSRLLIVAVSGLTSLSLWFDPLRLGFNQENQTQPASNLLELLNYFMINLTFGVLGGAWVSWMLNLAFNFASQTGFNLLIIGLLVLGLSAASALSCHIVNLLTISLGLSLLLICQPFLVFVWPVARALGTFVPTLSVAIAIGFGMASLPLPLLVLSFWLVAFSLRLTNTRWQMMVTLTVVTLGLFTGRLVLSLEPLVGWSHLAALASLIIGYYRLLPDYLVLIVFSLLLPTLANYLRLNPLTQLRSLPPHTTELVWLPLPNHDRILADAFRTDTSAALFTLQQMQASPLPGLQYTVKQALPQIVTNLVDAFDSEPSEVLETFQKMQALQLAGFQPTLTQALPQIVPVLVKDFASKPLEVLKTFQRTQALQLAGFQPTLEQALPQIVAGLVAVFGTKPSEVLETLQKMQALELAGFQFTLEQALPQIAPVLVNDFRIHVLAALQTLQKVQASRLPGYQSTIQQALPQIVADQLAQVSSVRDVILTATNEHPLLPVLVPTFYESETEIGNINLKTLSSVIEAEIFILLPRLQAVAKDVNGTLEARSAALRERGLERILNKLARLQVQLPSLGLNTKEIQRWQCVLQNWQEVIEQELKQQQQQSQSELINPFQYGNPLRSDRTYLFKGRQAFADNIVRLVLDRNRPTLVLHGPRRCGKSSFLLNLPRLLPSDMLPIYLDMQSAAVTTDEAAFCQGLVRAINKDSRSQGVELPAIPQRKEFLDTPYIALEDWLEQAVAQLGDRRLLLNLDEFEKIGSAINTGRMSLRLFDELRHLIQHYDQLGFLFSGVQTLDELGPNWSSYFISVVPIEMLYLEPHEAEDLLVNPDPEFTLRYDTGVVEEILTFTRCHPYLLQLVGSALVTQANLRHTQLVTSDLLQAAIQDGFTLGEPYFTNVWTEFTGTCPAEVAAGQELLLTLAQGDQPATVDEDETAVGAHLRAPLRRLLRYHVIENTGNGYRFEVPLLERWVRERAVRN